MSGGTRQRECAVSYVYVIGPEAGPQKVGFTGDPLSRLRELQRSSAARLRLAGCVAVPSTIAQAVERRAHVLLGGPQTRTERYDVPVGRALGAIQQASGAGLCDNVPRPAVALTVKLEPIIYQRLRQLCAKREAMTGERVSHQEVMLEALMRLLDQEQPTTSS